jgi:hypothetical protein
MFCLGSVREVEGSQSILRDLEQWGMELRFSFQLGNPRWQTEAIVCIRNGYTVIDNYEPYLGLKIVQCGNKFKE